MQACDADDCSEFSSSDSGWRSDPVPLAPGNVQASDGIHVDRVRVTCESSDGTDYYEVYRSRATDGMRTLLASPGNPLHDDLTAEAGMTYYYWIKACNSSVCSEFSEYDDGRIKDSYNLTLAISGQGNVVTVPDQLSFESGVTITLTAVSDTGWLFAGWSGDLKGETNPTTLLMDKNKFVTALFDLEDNGGQNFTAFLPISISDINKAAAFDSDAV